MTTVRDYHYVDSEFTEYIDSRTTYTYNDEGIRTSKTVNGVKHTYILNGSQILGEKWEDKMMLYVYDENGAPIGLKYRTNSYAEGVYEYYFFEKNLQGDIVCIYRATDATAICTYHYDAWGNFTIFVPSGTTLTEIDTQITTLNPFRYRGYYYDTETGFFHCHSWTADVSVFEKSQIIFSNLKGLSETFLLHLALKLLFQTIFHKMALMLSP